jgi:hypothetical protein
MSLSWSPSMSLSRSPTMSLSRSPNRRILRPGIGPMLRSTLVPKVARSQGVLFAEGVHCCPCPRCPLSLTAALCHCCSVSPLLCVSAALCLCCRVSLHRNDGCGVSYAKNTPIHDRLAAFENDAYRHYEVDHNLLWNPWSGTFGSSFATPAVTP